MEAWEFILQDYSKNISCSATYSAPFEYSNSWSNMVIGYQKLLAICSAPVHFERQIEDRCWGKLDGWMMSYVHGSFRHVFQDLLGVQYASKICRNKNMLRQPWIMMHNLDFSQEIPIWPQKYAISTNWKPFEQSVQGLPDCNFGPQHAIKLQKNGRMNFLVTSIFGSIWFTLH